jgi:hypothetical protein
MTLLEYDSRSFFKGLFFVDELILARGQAHPNNANA